jgi:hypothetical protein
VELTNQQVAGWALGGWALAQQLAEVEMSMAAA